MLDKPGFLLRIEGSLVLVVSVLFYWQARAGWGLFALLFLAPDLSMLGYLVNARLGAAFYNFGPHICNAVACYRVRRFCEGALAPALWADLDCAHWHGSNAGLRS